MTPTSIYLVGKDGIFKAGIKSLLADTDFHIVQDYNDIADMPKDMAADEDTKIIMYVDEGTGYPPEKVTALKGLYAQSRVMIVSSHTEMPIVTACFSAGVDGYILRDISCAALVGSLKLVATGEKVYPAFMFSALSNHEAAAVANGSGRNRTFNSYQLSKQELRIIRCLTNGEPNKIIAYNLNITEATVKVHIKAILRKLGAANRTQVAIWALAKGLGGEVQPLRARA